MSTSLGPAYISIRTRHTTFENADIFIYKTGRCDRTGVSRSRSGGTELIFRVPGPFIGAE